MQIIMKGISLPNPPGKTHGLEREDALFWSDWTLAGTIALAGSMLTASMRHEALSAVKLGIAFAAIFLGCTAFPFFLTCLRLRPARGNSIGRAIGACED